MGHRLTFGFNSLDQAYLDSKQVVAAVVLGWPLGWEVRTEGCTRAVNTLHEKLSMLQDDPDQRGTFALYSVGISFGGGQTVRISALLQFQY
jgi:hypothetical protein